MRATILFLVVGTALAQTPTPRVPVAKDGAGYFNLRPNTSSDPYCLVKLGRKRIAFCPVIYKTLNPKWNETFTFEVDKPLSKKIHIKVYDDDGFSRDDCIGLVVLLWIKGKVRSVRLCCSPFSSPLPLLLPLKRKEKR